MRSTCNLDDGYMGSGKRLRYSLRKHGIENHSKEILEYFDSRELLIEAEKKAITPEMITDNNCMNLKSGGEGGFISEEQQRYRSECAGKKFSEMRKNDLELDKNYREKLSIAISEGYNNGTREKKWGKDWTGCKHTEETKRKKSVLMKGKYDGVNHPQYGMCWITKDVINKKIKKEDLDSFIKEGWVKGRKLPQ